MYQGDGWNEQHPDAGARSGSCGRVRIGATPQIVGVRPALAIGTQVGLAGSMQGLGQFLGDLAYVTTPDTTAVIDGYDSEHEYTKEKRDYRADPAPDLAYRVQQLEYDGTLGEPWLYRLFTPDHAREAAIGTGWEVAEVKYGDETDHIYNLELRKR